MERRSAFRRGVVARAFGAPVNVTHDLMAADAGAMPQMCRLPISSDRASCAGFRFGLMRSSTHQA